MCFVENSLVNGVFGLAFWEQLWRRILFDPQFNRQRQSLRDYYQQKSQQGFEFAYQYPGMQKVSHALVRVIRSENDTGSALLIDPRCGEASYRMLLPSWWEYQDVE